MADDAPEPQKKPQAIHDVPKEARAEASEVARTIRRLIGPNPAAIDQSPAESLPSPLTPSDRSSDGDQSGGTGMARHPALESRQPSPSEVIDNPSRYLPPTRSRERDKGRER